MKHWVHWYRFEYALQHGSIYCHGLAKLKDDPGLCELTKVALKGYLASQAKRKLLVAGEINDVDFEQIEADITEGASAERKVCQYVDHLVSTCNPCDPEQEWVKPSVHPSKIPYTDTFEADEDYVNLLNSVQRHTLRNSAYCLKKKDDGSQYCRFNFPFDQCQKTHLEFEKIHTKYGTEKFKVKVATARNDSRMNCHQRLQLQEWRANCDLNIIIDYHLCIEYLTKYTPKAGKLSSVVRDAFVSVISKLSNQTPAKQAVKKLIMKAAGQRDMSVQKVMHQILSLILFS